MTDKAAILMLPNTPESQYAKCSIGDKSLFTLYPIEVLAALCEGLAVGSLRNGLKLLIYFCKSQSTYWEVRGPAKLMDSNKAHSGNKAELIISQVYKTEIDTFRTS